MNAKEAETFADDFAAAVLVPGKLAEACYAAAVGMATTGAQINYALGVARELVVSPITIAKRIDMIARSRIGRSLLGDAIFGATSNFVKEYGLVSSTLFSAGKPEASDLIRVSEKVFKSPMYPALRDYIAEHGTSEGIVAACLGIGPADAKAVLGELKA
jgi:hypothetical protein